MTGHPAEPTQAMAVAPFKTQLLKWVGSKQKFAHEIIAHFPAQFGTYHEPFLGAGGVMAVLAPQRGHGSDIYAPLIEIWQTLSTDPGLLKDWYAARWHAFQAGDRTAVYETVKARFNAAPNGADFLFLCRTCYGGVVRFRKSNGHMSTPCGSHPAMPPAAFAKRVDLWHRRLQGARFDRLDYREAMERAAPGDLVYCDPPYSFSQTILYGAQTFHLPDLFDAIARAKSRGVRVALSIDGTKKSGGTYCDIPLPEGVFQREIMVNVGRSMLRRFQMGGQTLEAEEVKDRLLLTY
ncbi:DNA adenine methylase [Tabrizicola oligotrophica]|uniref:site-specific DNA-methyltransferase (adenine-specific) n=1 Tax=Tabrizicola oligotrophica TaxID=2710650 RepID=A0A6M0QY52_9RHOB|nr:DNA adenine methylase [Tabrizicola oligotrophica]NEY91683.1 DNA adenine methylase [Tabrizicola oligotrophica]